jgi:hypothetical protein
MTDVATRMVTSKAHPVWAARMRLKATSRTY